MDKRTDVRTDTKYEIVITTLGRPHGSIAYSCFSAIYLSSSRNGKLSSSRSSFVQYFRRSLFLFSLSLKNICLVFCMGKYFLREKQKSYLKPKLTWIMREDFLHEHHKINEQLKYLGYISSFADPLVRKRGDIFGPIKKP